MSGTETLPTASPVGAPVAEAPDAAPVPRDAKPPAATEPPAVPPSAAPPVTAGLTTPTEDAITTVLAAGIILGGATDGWAHVNRLDAVQAEGFFTPWHGLLYSAFTATAAWTFWLAYRRRHAHPRWWRDGWPAGYRLGALGVVIFMVAGFFDMIWHTVFGIETSIDALLSPSHLLLSAGSVMLMTSPVRSWWAAGGGGLRAACGAVALALGTTSVSIFLGYAVAFEHVNAVEPYNGERLSEGYTAAARGVAAYVITTAILVVPLLLAHRRRATFGVGTALVAWVALFPVVVNEFHQPQATGAFAAIAAAILADWLLVRLDRWRGPDAIGRLPIAGAVFAGLVTTAHLLAVHLDSGIRWPVELWTGSVFTTVAVAAVLGGLATRPRLERSPTARVEEPV
jgi:hypothetical protein